MVIDKSNINIFMEKYDYYTYLSNTVYLLHQLELFTLYKYEYR